MFKSRVTCAVSAVEKLCRQGDGSSGLNAPVNKESKGTTCRISRRGKALKGYRTPSPPTELPPLRGRHGVAGCAGQRALGGTGRGPAMPGEELRIHL